MSNIIAESPPIIQERGFTMRLTILLQINEKEPAGVTTPLLYDSECDIGFADLVAPDEDAARDMIASAISELHGAKDHSEIIGKLSSGIACRWDGDCYSPKAGKEDFEQSANGKRVFSGIKKGLALVETHPRSGLYGDEITYFKDRFSLDFFSGMSALFHLGFFRGYNAGKRDAKKGGKS